MIRYLFLCAEGQKRSPTAVIVARQLAARKGLHIEAESGGINYLREESIPQLRQRYDKLVVMEWYMAHQLVALGVEQARVVCLDIPDHYERADSGLVKLLEEKLATV